MIQVKFIPMEIGANMMSNILLVGCVVIFLFGVSGFVDLLKKKSDSLFEYMLCIAGILIGLFMGYLIVFYR